MNRLYFVLEIRAFAIVVIVALPLLSACESGQRARNTDGNSGLSSSSTTTGHKKQPDEPTPPGMVWVPGGEFAMGGDDDKARPDEKPIHQVRVSGFWMDATEVTNGQFRKFVTATHYVTVAEKGLDRQAFTSRLRKGVPPPRDEAASPLHRLR